MAAECLEYQSAGHKKPDVVFVRPRQARMLPDGPGRIVIIALREMERILARLLESKSRAEFEGTRKSVFSDYTNLTAILANSFSIHVDKSVREMAIRQAFQNVARRFETQGKEALGASVAGEAIFCLSTLKRAYRVLSQIDIEAPVSEELRRKDFELASQFNAAAIWAQLHTECLLFAIKKRTGLNQEVLTEVLVGMRSSVMAYSYVRQGLELRTTRQPYLSSDQQDDEDCNLLEESYLDSGIGSNAEP
jgi:hypothetical protein